MPGPTSYNISSKFDMNRSSVHNLKNGKGYTFSLSHKAYEKVYNEATPGKKGLGPDAGLYNLKSFVELKMKDGKKFTLGHKKDEAERLKAYMLSP